MKNALKAIALVAMIGVSTAAYAQQKSITITGLPNTYKGKVAMLAITPSAGSENYTAYSLGTLSGASVTFPLSDWTTDKPWNGSGNFAFVILIGESANAIASKQLLYTGGTSATTNVNQRTTTVQWSQFLSVDQQSAAKDTGPKSITISGIPNTYKGKAAMLGLAPTPGSQNYTAYSLGTINGASVTFPLSDWTTDKPWTGSGDFAFIIIVGDSAQAIANKQYLYTGQTAATSNVSHATTSIQWSQFGSAAQQSTTQDAGQKSITISGIPNRYKGKAAMLGVAPTPGSQNYTAYSLGTISGASVTFPLSDWTTDKPWSGSGDFAFIIIVGETAQAIANKQYLYTGQTLTTSGVNRATSTIQWSQFVAK
jgi:hypothetical protein